MALQAKHIPILFWQGLSQLLWPAVCDVCDDGDLRRGQPSVPQVLERVADVHGRGLLPPLRPGCQQVRTRRRRLWGVPPRGNPFRRPRPRRGVRRCAPADDPRLQARPSELAAAIGDTGRCGAPGQFLWRQSRSIRARPSPLDATAPARLQPIPPHRPRAASLRAPGSAGIWCVSGVPRPSPR